MTTGGAVSGLRRAVETEFADDGVERCADGLAGGDVVLASGEPAAANIRAPVTTADTQTMAAAMRLSCCERSDIALGGRQTRREPMAWHTLIAVSVPAGLERDG